MPSAAPEFVELADYILGDIKAHLDPYRRQLADQVEYLVWPEATEDFLVATGTSENQILLGAFEPTPRPRISIFQKSLEKFAISTGGVIEAIRQTLNHEIWQHYFGTDHTRETLEMGLLPAYKLPSSACG